MHAQRPAPQHRISSGAGRVEITHLAVAIKRERLAAARCWNFAVSCGLSVSKELG